MPLSVLVLDRDRDAADRLANLLTLHGFRARPAYGEADALASALADPPHAVVASNREARDGCGLASRLRDRPPGGDPRPLFIALTDGPEPDAAGVDLQLQQSAHPGVLVGVLDRFTRFVGAGR